MRRLWMRVMAVSVAATGTDTASGHQTLEMIVRPNAGGGLDAASQDAGPLLCRLLRGGQEEWSGAIRWDEDRWVVHSDLGDDEPIRFLYLKTLRPGDYIRLCNPGGEEVNFRIEQVTRTHALEKPLSSPWALWPGTHSTMNLSGPRA
jgi:hypothetical protein